MTRAFVEMVKEAFARYEFMRKRRAEIARLVAVRNAAREVH